MNFGQTIGIKGASKHKIGLNRSGLALLVLSILAAAMLFSGCCSFPGMGKCSTTVPVQINLIADEDSNAGRSVKVTAYLLTNSDAFMNMQARDFFSTGKEDYVKNEIGHLPDQVSLFVGPTETKSEIVDIPRDNLGNKDLPLFLGIIAYFSAPAPGEDRMIIPLTGRDFARKLDIQVTNNSLLPAR